LDSPGHKDFSKIKINKVKNMINGTSQADFAILVVDSSKNSFESGFNKGGQTKEHLLLSKNLGISNIIIAVNKMDNINYDEERFQEIVYELSKYMKKLGYLEEDLYFIPCSGLTGDNLNIPSEKIEWYKGPTIVSKINEMKAKKRDTEKALRLSVHDVYESTFNGITIAGIPKNKKRKN
jgi:translation elongation factor EF-1alpha